MGLGWRICWRPLGAATASKARTTAGLRLYLGDTSPRVHRSHCVSSFAEAADGTTPLPQRLRGWQADGSATTQDLAREVLLKFGGNRVLGIRVLGLPNDQ